MKAILLAAALAVSLSAAPAHAGFIQDIGSYLTKGLTVVRNYYSGTGSQAISSVPNNGGISIYQQPSVINDLEKKVRTVTGWRKIGVKHDGARTYHTYRSPNGSTITKEGSRAYQGAYGGLYSTIQTHCSGTGCQ
jgi:hypothetical protein